MNILGIDTSTSLAGVALSTDGEVSTETWNSRHNHGREVMPAVMRLLNASGIDTTELDAVAVALGPGGFSAVRVGIATGQGLVGPSGAPLIGVPTHLIQSYEHRNASAKRVVSLIPIGRNQLSYIVYANPITGTSEEIDGGICGIAEIGNSIDWGGAIACGEGILSIEAEHGIPTADASRSPENVVAIALQRIARNNDVIEPVTPIYSRPPTITAPRKR